jgi:hypothetical protein
MHFKKFILNEVLRQCDFCRLFINYINNEIKIMCFGTYEQMYFKPLPVLNKMMYSSGCIDPWLINFASAAKEAAPSGHENIPSL